MLSLELCPHLRTYTNIVDIMALKIVSCIVADCVAITITTFRNMVKTNLGEHKRHINIHFMPPN